MTTRRLAFAALVAAVIGLVLSFGGQALGTGGVLVAQLLVYLAVPVLLIVVGRRLADAARKDREMYHRAIAVFALSAVVARWLMSFGITLSPSLLQGGPPDLWSLASAYAAPVGLGCLALATAVTVWLLLGRFSKGLRVTLSIVAAIPISLLVATGSLTPWFAVAGAIAAVLAASRMKSA